MECPECEKELQIPSYAIKNMECYGNSILIRTLCCGKLLKAWPTNQYRAAVYVGDAKLDDWGG